MALQNANISIDARHQMRCTGNFFPARTKFKAKTDGGAWLVAHNADERNRIEAILRSKPLTFEQVKELRRKAEKNGTPIVLPGANDAAVDAEGDLLLDGFFLLKFCAAQDPSDLCIVNISGQGLTETKPEDFLLFDNVTSINASENLLPLEPFGYFPGLQKLEIAVNGLRGIKLAVNEFRLLQDLDMSYNNLSTEDVLMLGVLSSLCVLNISGNNLSKLSEDMSYPASVSGANIQMIERIERFPSLERLTADDNRLTEASCFTALAGLKRLKFLSVAKNEVTAIPHLLLAENRYMIVEGSISKTQRRSKQKRSDSNSHITQKNLTEQNHMNFGSAADKMLSDMNESVHSPCPPQPSPSHISDVHPALPSSDLLPCPFSCLVSLNLASNKISEERSLLSVASWPKIQKLIIHDNPLTTRCSGELPILKKFLQERLNIQIQRKKTPEVEKPHIQVQDTSKKIKTKVPSMPRCKIEDLLLAIEGPKTTTTCPPSSSSDRSTCEQRPSSAATCSTKMPLPPIERCSSCSSSSKTSRHDGSKENHPVPNRRKEADRGDSEENSQLAKECAWAENSTDPIFMTEMMNDILTEETKEGGREDRIPTEAASDGKYPGTALEQDDDDAENEDNLEYVRLQKKYKMYDELLTVEETALDEFLPPAHDVNGNVRALRHIINHPLIFRDKAVCLERKQKPFQPWTKKPDLSCKPSKTKMEKTAAVLENMKLRSTFIEAPLTDVLSGKSHQKEFGDARKLLNEVQHCYNGVRVTSMKKPDELNLEIDERNIKPLFALHAKNNV